jgi:LPS export ABC transporter protein LptC
MKWELRRLAIGVILLLAASASWWFLRNVEQPKSSVQLTADAQKQPDYYMENFRAALMDADGQRKYTLEAQLMQHYPHNHTVHLIKPHFVQFKAGRATIDGWADVGWYDTVAKEVILAGNVKVIQKRDASSRGSETTAARLRVLLK